MVDFVDIVFIYTGEECDTLNRRKPAKLCMAKDKASGGEKFESL